MASGNGMKRSSDDAVPFDIPGVTTRDPLPGSSGYTGNEIPHILPHEKVFPIQIGSELFRLSGASISSDGKCLFYGCLEQKKYD